MTAHENTNTPDESVLGVGSMVKSNHGERLAALIRDIGSPKSVPAIDKALEDVGQEWIDMLGVREVAARRHGVTSPPPAPPWTCPVCANKVSVPEVHRKNARHSPPTEPVKDLKLVAGSLAAFLWDLIESKPLGISHHELREAFDNSKRGADRTDGRGAHYQSLHRLKTSGHVRSWKGRIWATHHLIQFQADVAAGRVQDIEEEPRFKSKWSSNILNHLRERDEWISTHAVAEYMGTLPAYANRKNLLNQAAAVLRTLQLRGTVERKGDSVKGSFWRAVKTVGNGPMTETERAAEASPSAARH
jgi:hypothetical protein